MNRSRMEKSGQSIPDPKSDIEERKPDDPKKGFFIINAGTSILEGDEFNLLHHLQIGVGEYLMEKVRYEIYGGGGWASVSKHSELDQSIDHGIGIVTIGGHLKYFFTPRHTFVGPYFLLGLAYNHMFWSYENPIQVDSETIDKDNLGGLEVYTGLGLNLMQFETVHIGAELLPGIYLWHGTTAEGFDNDVFESSWFMKARMTFTFFVF